MSELEKQEQKNKALRVERDELSSERQKLKAQNSRLSSELATVQEKADKAVQRFEGFKADVAMRESPARRLVVDISGGTTAFGLTASINWLFRLIARKFPSSWWARNIDWLQGAPHFALGILAYGLDLYGRSTHLTKDSKYLPSGWREGFGESAKVFAELGASNVLRAIRVRMTDGKEQQTSLVAQNAALAAALAAYKQKYPND